MIGRSQRRRHHGGRNRKYRFKALRQKRAAQKKFQEHGLGCLPKEVMFKLREGGRGNNSSGEGESDSDSSMPPQAKRRLLTCTDVVSWLTSNPYAFREAGSDGFRDSVEYMRQERRRQTAVRRAAKDRSRQERVDDPDWIMQDHNRQDSDGISLSSWEGERAYKDALQFYKQHHGEHGVGFKSVAKQFAISWARLKKMVERDGRVECCARDCSDSESDFGC